MSSNSIWYNSMLLSLIQSHFLLTLFLQFICINCSKENNLSDKSNVIAGNFCRDNDKNSLTQFNHFNSSFPNCAESKNDVKLFLSDLFLIIKLVFALIDFVCVCGWNPSTSLLSAEEWTPKKKKGRIFHQEKNCTYSIW